MKIDLTLQVRRTAQQEAGEYERKVFSGHYGTHFDVMDQQFPLDYTELEGVVFDVAHVGQAEVQLADVDLDQVGSGMFVAFASGFIEREGYGTKTYFHEHPSLSVPLIEALIAKGVAIIGVDFAGVRRGAEHTPMDQHCANHGVFIVENLCRLTEVLNGQRMARFHAHTYPVSFADLTGLPCRVVADVANG